MTPKVYIHGGFFNWPPPITSFSRKVNVFRKSEEYPDWPSPKISLCVKLAPHKINKSSKGSPQIKNGGLPKGDNVPFFTVFFLFECFPKRRNLLTGADTKRFFFFGGGGQSENKYLPADT